MNFHGRMMNIQIDPDGFRDGNMRTAYSMGHKDARHAAAEIAMEADREIERLKNRVVELERELQSEYDTQAGASL